MNTEHRRYRSVRSGFTLFELLLVVAILGVASIIALPSFVRSMKGNRLRTAGRTVVTVGKYARRMAVLEQTEMRLTLNLDAGVVSVQPAGSVPRRPIDGEGEDGDEGGLSMNAGGASSGSIVDTGFYEEDEPEAATGDTSEYESLTRTLDQVRIDYVDLLGSEDRKFVEGSCSVLYRSNGTCDPYEVRIVDEEGRALLIEVDHVSAAETRREDAL